MSELAEVMDTSFARIGLSKFPAVELGEPNEAMIRRVESIRDGGMFLVPSEFMGVSGSKRVRASFVENKDDAKGRENGMHLAYFGKLTIDSKWDHELPTSVAIKPYTPSTTGGFYSPEEALVNEWAANEYVNRLSDYERAYLPLGVWRLSTGSPQLITLFDEPVQTFDNIFWPKPIDITNITPEKMTKALQLSMYAIGVMHGAGLIHGDAHIGNFGRDSNRVRLIDLETTQLLPFNDERDIEDSREVARDLRSDINKIFASITTYKMVSEEMYQKVVKVIGYEDIAEQLVKDYWCGIAQGGARNGTTLPEKLILQPEDLIDKIQFIIKNIDVLKQ